MPLGRHPHGAVKQTVLGDNQVKSGFAHEMIKNGRPVTIPSDRIAVAIADQTGTGKWVCMDFYGAVMIGADAAVSLKNLNFVATQGKRMGEGLNGHLCTAGAVVVIVK
jgi:hypothetical protein